MTALTIGTDIPSAIVTVEQLHLWSALVLEACNPKTITIELYNGDPEFVMNIMKLKTPNYGDRLITRGSLPLLADYGSVSRKPWLHIDQISNIAIPTAFKSNT